MTTKKQLECELKQALQTLRRIDDLIEGNQDDHDQAKWELSIAIRKIEKLELE